MTAPKLITIANPAIDPDVVAELELLLDRAKSGKLRAIAFAAGGFDDDGKRTVRVKNVGFADQIELIGRIAAMHHKVVTDFLDE